MARPQTPSGLSLARSLLITSTWTDPLTAQSSVETINI